MAFYVIASEAKQSIAQRNDMLLLKPRPACGERSTRTSRVGGGVQVTRHLPLAEAAPHPDPLPVKNGEREKHTYAGTTSSLITRNFTRSIRPKLVVSATSAASRPVPIRMRPARGTLWRASKVYHWPDR